MTKEETRESKKKWRVAHPELCIKYAKDYRKRYPERTYERDRKHNLQRKYKLTDGRYDEVLKAQNGLCALCGKVPDTWFVVDHDHVTGKFRGLLCHLCNAALGMIKDDIAVAKKLVLYLEENKKDAHI